MSKTNIIIFPAILLLLIIVIVLINPLNNKNISIESLPYSYKFAFTITDDPDNGWFEQKKVVFDFLDSLDLKISIGVWMYKNFTGSADDDPFDQGIALDNNEYLEYIKTKKENGHTLFLHTITGGNDNSNVIRKGFEDYNKIFGEYPNHWINHFSNYDNIYWGEKRINWPLLRLVYKLFKKKKFYGDNENSQYYWGDLCKKHITFVRSFGTNNINTQKANPSMPYHDPNKESVKYWYGCSDGYDCNKFNDILSEENVNQLINENGICILYTHFASAFVDTNNKLNPVSKQRLRYISQQEGGWFVPPETILNRLINLRKIEIVKKKDRYIIVNTGNDNIEDLQIKVKNPKGLFYNNKRLETIIDSKNILHIKTLNANSAIYISKKDFSGYTKMGFFEELSLVLQWMFR